MIAWPDGLVSDLARRRCMVVIGSGISANATNSSGTRPSTWAGLVGELLKGVPDSRFTKQLRRQFDYLTLCEIAEEYHGRNKVGEILRQQFVTPGFKPAPMHEDIFNLDSRIVVTPSFDKIYETFACHKADGTIVVKNYYDSDIVDYIRSNTRIILKMHGTVDAPAQCILTRRDYASARSKYRSFYEMLFGLFLTNSVLFVGCGFSDPDIRLLLEDSRFRFISSSPHYFVVPTDECDGSYRDVLERSLNVVVIGFSKRKRYCELSCGLHSLAGLVDAEREKLKMSGNW